MNYIYYNEFGKEVKKLIMPIAKGSSNIKIIIFSDLDNMASSPYKVSAAFKRADGLVAGDIALSNSVDKKTNPYNQVEMYYRELVIGNDLTELVGGLELSLKYVTTESIEVEPNVFYDEDTIRVQAMAVFNIYNAVSFITPPQNTQLVNLRNYVDAQNIIIFNEYDGKLFLKADKIDTYLKSEVYNKDESYNKTEINNLNDLKANASEVFSKEETYNRDTINDLVADVPNKANIVILQSITTQPATATVGQIYYNAYDKKIYLYDGSDWGVNNVGANGILYMFNNVLYVYNTYDGLIKIGQKPLAFDTLYVDSLSSNINDFNYLTVENQIIANSGIDVKSHKIINVQDPTTNQDAATKKYVDDSIITVEGGLNNYYTKVQTYSQDEINSLIASNYKAKGNLAPAGLVAGLLIAANLGNVYNITGQFTTTSNFLEGAGKVHEAGENVVIVEYSAGVYKFDVLSSFVDLSSYALKTELLTLGTTSNDAYRGDLGQIAYNHSQSDHAPSNAQKNSDITKAEIEAKLIGEITTHSHALPNHIPLSKISTGSSYTDILIGTPEGSIGTLSQSTFAPATHNHTKSQITDFPTIPTVTNDLTNALKSNYDAAYTHSQTTHAPSNAEQNVQSDWNQTINTEDDFIKNKPTIPSKTSDLTNDSGFATETYVNNKVSAVYKPQGSLAFNGLVVGLLVAANNGFVYNITDAFTTNENFVEGAGKSHSAGTNVVIVYNSSSYKFDVLGGTVDLTPYELQSNKVSSWSETTNDTRYPSEKLVKDSLDAINVGLENIGSLSPLRFAGYFTGGTVSNDFNNLIRPFENLTNPLSPDFYINNIKGAMFVCNAASDFVFNTVYFWSAEEGTGKTTPITFNWAAPYDQGIGTTNFEVGDTISILNFAYDTVENEMFILVKVEKSSGVKADKVIPASTGNIPKLNASGNLEDSGFKLEKSVPSNAVFTDTVPTDYVVKNSNITGATKTKITYDAKGLVTAGEDLIADDIPALAINKITNLSTTLSSIDSDISALETTVAGIEDLLEAI